MFESTNLPDFDAQWTTKSHDFCDFLLNRFCDCHVLLWKRVQDMLNYQPLK